MFCVNKGCVLDREGVSFSLPLDWLVNFKACASAL